ncbi:MAG: hypothetical protein ACXADC_17865 [Candidatus Thorarchaeota archaeon]|jgi:hypothetical protein
MNTKNKVVVGIRVISMLVGGAIVAWFASLYLRMLSLYPDANFWYFTSSTITNLSLALLFHFALIVLVLLPIYPPKTAQKFGFALVGTICLAVGRAFTVPITGFFYWVGFNEPIGLGLTVVAFVFIILAYRPDSDATLENKDSSLQ